MSAGPSVKLSIVTVCWNDLANVQRTVESLQRQSQRDGWEHVLIDGGSSDGTAEWYRASNFAFPHRVISEPDEGIFDAMNKALNVITGPYVVFMNAGDRYADAGAIGRLLSRLSDEPLWGYTKASVIDENGRKVRPQVGRVPYSRLSHLLGRATICHQAVIMRVDFLRALGGFDCSMGTAADYHLLVRAASRTRPVAWPDVDVEFLAGGVSDSGVYVHLWNRHRARVDALNLKSVGGGLDSVWTATQVLDIRTRKKLKPVLGRFYLKVRK